MEREDCSIFSVTYLMDHDFCSAFSLSFFFFPWINPSDWLQDFFDCIISWKASKYCVSVIRRKPLEMRRTKANAWVCIQIKLTRWDRVDKHFTVPILIWDLSFLSKYFRFWMSTIPRKRQSGTYGSNLPEDGPMGAFSRFVKSAPEWSYLFSNVLFLCLAFRVFTDFLNSLLLIKVNYWFAEILSEIKHSTDTFSLAKTGTILQFLLGDLISWDFLADFHNKEDNSNSFFLLFIYLWGVFEPNLSRFTL